MSDPTPRPTESVLLVEYEQAQSSAQHHDSLVWTVSNALWAISLVLFGFMVNILASDVLRCAELFLPLVFVTVITGSALPLFAMLFQNQLATVKRHKYLRCKAIYRPPRLTLGHVWRVRPCFG